MKKLLIVTLSVLCLGKIFAQNDAQLSQMYANKLYYNPAATGMSDKFFASGAYRAQWAGTDNVQRKDRPRYLVFNAAQFFWEERSGVGLTIYDARQSVDHSFQIKGSYAYHLQVQDEAWLAMGINVGLISKGIQGSVTPSQQSIDSRAHMMSDIGLGIEYLTPELCVGASVQHLPWVIGNREERMHTHFYYYLTYFHQYDYDWRFIPSIALRNSVFITSGEVALRASYINMFQLGLAYRLDAFAILLGFNFEDMLTVGYSIDFSTGFARRQSLRPSHEITLSYRTQIINQYNTLERLPEQVDF